MREFDLVELDMYWVNQAAILSLVPATFVANYVLQNYGLKIGVLCGTSLALAGSFIRILLLRDKGYLFFGQFLIGFSGPFITNSYSQVAVTWFLP